MIIGLVGFIGSGKGTVGELLTQDHNFIQDSFAAPLKDAVAAIFGWDREMLEGNTKASRDWREKIDQFWSEKFDKPFTPRLALQLMGTEAGRNVFHQDLWVASLLNRCNQRAESTVVTDVRFKNEVAALQKAGGVIVRIRRGTEPTWFETAKRANEGDSEAYTNMIGIHQSEWDWIGSPMNHIIYNDGTLADLRDNVRHIIANKTVFESHMPTQISSDSAVRM
jgi:hypothetical protein